MKSYFLSDLHLTPERPAIAQEFCRFLTEDAPTAERVYLLGDLFEFWIGDDAASLLGAEPILDVMQQLAESVPCFFIAGNRDFLVGEEFSKRSGFQILADESVIDLYGTPTLILHGDSLCTEDTAHQVFRQQIVNNETWRGQFLSLPIPQRIEQAKQARMQSHQHKSQVSMEIMDVTKQTVIDAFSRYGVQQMIHGHTHRQASHTYQTKNGTCRRHVLGDWGSYSSVMTASATGITIENRPIV